MNRKMRANLSKQISRTAKRAREKLSDRKGTGIDCPTCGDELHVGDIVTFDAEIVAAPDREHDRRLN
jgi:hypothetical protein